MGKGPVRGYYSRSRNIADFDKKFSEHCLEKAVQEAIGREGSQRKVRVLEIGCGEGRVMMDLRKLFPDIEIHGINKKPWAAMRGRESLRRTGIFYKIFKRPEIDSVKLPYVHFYDASKMHFKANYFDVVYSQVSIYQVERKDLLLEDIWRVLKRDGVALLDIDGIHADYPDFLQYDMPRFILYKAGKPYRLSRYFADLKREGYDLTTNMIVSRTKPGAVEHRRLTLIMRKNKPSLEMGLEFDPLSSFDLKPMGMKTKTFDIVGYRSVYRVV